MNLFHLVSSYLIIQICRYLKMLPPPLILLSLTFFIPISPAAAAAPPLQPHQSHLTKNNYHLINDKRSATYRKYFELTRPLPLDNLTPSCRLPVFSHIFNSSTAGLSPATFDYSLPKKCTWSNVSLHLEVASKGSRDERIASAWLDGVELLRTSTPGPNPNVSLWSVRKDITRYSSRLRQANLTLTVVLGSLVNEGPTGADVVYQMNLTFLYYIANCHKATTDGVDFPISLDENSDPPNRKENPLISMLKSGDIPLDSYDTPADLIIPIVENADDGFWFRIENDSDVKYIGIQIPSNTYKAVIEVYVSFHGDDEFWYSNPPNSYIDINNLKTKKGNGAYREVLVSVDDNVVGSAIPFPVIYPGGINPLFWDPIVSIGAFDMPTYTMDLTPFLGMLLDGKVHAFGLRVSEAISFWLVNANLHLWLDDNAKQVQAMTIQYRAPSSYVKYESRFQDLDGTFKVEGQWESDFSGWVSSSSGNITSRVFHKLKFENTITFTQNGTHKVVKQEVQDERELRVRSNGRNSLQLNTHKILKKRYPLLITTTTLAGLMEDTYKVTTNLEQTLREQNSNERLSRSLINTQKCGGWAFVHDRDVLSGSATTRQSYTYRDETGCYSKVISATDGRLGNERTSLLCSLSQ